MPSFITSSPFSHRIRLGWWVRESCFANTLCIYVCVNNHCLPLLQQGLQSELFMQDLNTCKWFTCLSWRRSRLPMATAPPRSSTPHPHPQLQSATHPPTVLSTQWYCFNWCYSRLGGCTLWGGRISPNLKSRSCRQGRTRYGGWTDGRRAGSLHPAARTWSSGEDAQKLKEAASGGERCCQSCKGAGTHPPNIQIQRRLMRSNWCSKTGWAEKSKYIVMILIHLRR